MNVIEAVGLIVAFSVAIAGLTSAQVVIVKSEKVMIALKLNIFLNIQDDSSNEVLVLYGNV